MDVEISIKSIQYDANKNITGISADGFLWVDGLRIYAVEDIGYVCQQCSERPPGRAKAASVEEVFPHEPNRSASHEEPLLSSSENSSFDFGFLLASRSYDFMRDYKVCLPLYTGAMAKGIGSADLVIANGRNDILGSFGCGGLPPAKTEAGLQKIQQALVPNDTNNLSTPKPYAVNLIHSPFDDKLEKQNVDLFLKYKVPVVEASAFMKVTKHLVRYRLKGLSLVGTKIQCTNRVIGKCSRTELASMFLHPSPPKLVVELLEEGSITPLEAELAQFVPLADDIAVEADSGGHTDNRPFTVLFANPFFGFSRRSVPRARTDQQ